MDICKVVSSIQNKDKINVCGYLIIKDKKRNNSYYWYCEKRDQLRCRGRATTLFTEDQHYLVKATEHNHAAEASRVKVVKSLNLLKERAQQTTEQPVQVIQRVVAGSSQEICPYLPSRDALRQTVKRVRRTNLPAEPQSLATLIIPENMQITLSGSNFLVRNLNIGDGKVLIFTTSNNINYLSQSSFWIMDGTFKTVPTIFKQLYTIHGSVGSNENSRVMPLVFSLMSNKSEECYKALFQNLINFGDENNLDLQPQFVLTDFKIAAINAVRIEFPGVRNKGCHFHLSQSVYRKVQASGLTAQYASDENLSLFIRHIPALAFLPYNDIPAAFDKLRNNVTRHATRSQ